MSEQSKPTFALLNLEAIRDNRYDPDFDEFTEQDAHEILNYIAALEVENAKLKDMVGRLIDAGSSLTHEALYGRHTTDNTEPQRWLSLVSELNEERQ